MAGSAMDKMKGVDMGNLLRAEFPVDMVDTSYYVLGREHNNSLVNAAYVIAPC